MTPSLSTLAFRFGYGLPLPKDAPTDSAAMLAALAGPDIAAQRHPGAGIDAALPLIQAFQAARKASKGSQTKTPAYLKAQKAIGRAMLQQARVSFARALDAPDGYRERLVRFWADHFTVAARNRPEALLPGTLIEDAIRPHINGTFTAMLQAVTLHPAMLIYLDQVNSTGPNSARGKRREKGLNENLARELMELHTLGVGAGYGQDDVRQMAELLTGLGVDKTGGFAFDPRRAEPGPETVLGITYTGEGPAPVLAALQDLANRPETAQNIASKLAVHFVSDTPDAGLVADLTDVFMASGGDLAALHRALLTHPAALQARAEKARQPFDFLIAALRALGLNGADLDDGTNLRAVLLLPMQAMGQPWQSPIGPNGWPEAVTDWITPQGLAARINWAMTMPAKLQATLPDPVALAKAALGDRASEALLTATSRAESLREGVGLVFASPEFNRR